MTAQRFITFTLLPLLLLVTFLIYKPGLKGDFLFDDGPNIVNNTAVKITSLSSDSLLQAALSGTSGDLKRPISMLSFGINYALSGLNPYAFKLTNLVIHLMVGGGLYILTMALLCTIKEARGIRIPGQRWLPLLVSAAWLLHPLNLIPVLYIVQRMTSLAALFIVCGLIFYVWGRLRMLRGTRHGFSLILAGLAIFWPLAILSKENGILLPIYMFAIEFLLLEFRTPNTRSRRFLVALFAAALAVPLLAFLILLGGGGLERFLRGYQIRDFDILQRLMSESRALWFYFSMLVAPNNGMMGLFHDDFPISRDMLTPPTTLFACIGVAAATIIALLQRKRSPMLSFGIIFFLGGHLLESTIFPLELVHEHRNYLPGYGILLALSYYLAQGAHVIRRASIRWAFAGTAVILLATTTTLRAEQWSNPINHGQYEVMHHPLSERANYEMGRIYEQIYAMDTKRNEQLDIAARQYFVRSSQLDENSTQGLFGAIISGESAGNVDTDNWLEEAKDRLASRPMSPMNAASLASYIKCQYNNNCRLRPDTTRELLEIALSNPTMINGLSKAFIQSTASVFFAVATPEHEQALHYARAAVATLPNEIQYKINLANVLIALKRYDEARAILRLSRQMDRTGAYALRILDQERFLNESQQTLTTTQASPTHE